MSSPYEPRMLPLAAFARSEATLSGAVPLAELSRLHAQSIDMVYAEDARFTATGSERFDATGHPQVWLHLRGACRLTQVCQRCLRPAGIDIEFQRDFRFVANEAVAAVEDEESEEDVLVFARQFDLVELLEDELLMAMPLVPMHASCPETPRFSLADPDFDAQTPQPANPFAVLASLKHTPSTD